MEKISLKVYAKINLSLNILGAVDGMHSLDTVMTSVDIADVISAVRAKNNASSISFFPPDKALEKSNTVAKALSQIGLVFDDVFVDVKVDKHIPFCGGLGGSSADAAGVLFAIDKIFGLIKRGLKMLPTALNVGSDVPYMLSGGFARVLDNGICVKNQNFFKQICLVICKDKMGVSTAQAFKKFDEIYANKMCVKSDNDALINALKSSSKFDFLGHVGNALTEASIALEPTIKTTLLSLDKAGSLKSFMTGSGSACVGVFEDFDKAKRAESELKAKGYFALATTTVPNGIEIINE